MCDRHAPKPIERRDRHPLAVLNWPFIGLVLLYRVTLSPLMGGQCRFSPTCSQYALDCLRTHHPFRAVPLAAWRILRCNPFGGHGPDPAPPLRRRGDDAQPLRGPGQPGPRTADG